MGYEVALTKEEAELLACIELDQSKLDHERYKQQGPLVLQLLKSLVDRDAIPEVRRLYWSDPEYQIGRLKTSHKGLFERNGRQGEEIYTRPHFLKYLRYFLFGAQLPEGVISEFEEAVGNPEWVSSGDITDITKGTRKIVCKYDLQTEDEEFYRLALDVGLSQSYAHIVRDAVKQVR